MKVSDIFDAVGFYSISIGRWPRDNASLPRKRYEWFPMMIRAFAFRTSKVRAGAEIILLFTVTTTFDLRINQSLAVRGGAVKEGSVRPFVNFVATEKFLWADRWGGGGNGFRAFVP